MKLIALTQGQFAQVDDSDYLWLNQWKWYAQNTKTGFYAVRKDSQGCCILMNRLILGLTDKSIKGEHIDRNSLNNQRNNLRSATHAQNMSNRRVLTKTSSKYLGVRWFTRDKKWYAGITKDNKGIHLGSFDTEIEAALAYNNAAKKLHGEFANLNLLSLPND